MYCCYTLSYLFKVSFKFDVATVTPEFRKRRDAINLERNAPIINNTCVVAVCSYGVASYCHCVVVHERTVYEGLFTLARTFLFVVVGFVISTSE